MLIVRNKVLIFLFSIVNGYSYARINKRGSNREDVQRRRFLLKRTSNNRLANKNKLLFKVRLKPIDQYGSCIYTKPKDFRNCYTEQSKKSVLINKNYQDRVLNVLKELENKEFQEDLKGNSDQFFKDQNFTPNEVSFLLFRLYHPKDKKLNQDLINAILKTSLLEFNKDVFLKFQEEFNKVWKEYQDLELAKKNLSNEKELNQINEKIKQKKEEIESTDLIILLENLVFPVKKAKICLKNLKDSLYRLHYVFEYKELSPAGIAYFLLCLLRYYDPEVEEAFYLSQNLDQTKLTVINDERFILDDFTESKTPFMDYKNDFEVKFLEIYK